MVTLEPPIPAGTEYLDARGADAATARVILAELGRVNALFGGVAAVRDGVALVAHALPADRPVRVLDVGAGGGDVAVGVARALAARGHTVHTLALDHLRAAAAACRGRGLDAVLSDWGDPPLRPRSADLVVASLVLHHLERRALPEFLRRLSRLARRAVVVADLRRSRVAAAGLRAAGAALRFHQATVRDGVVSLRRGFTESEFHDLLARAGIAGGMVRRRPWWRIVACWSVRDADA